MLLVWIFAILICYVLCRLWIKFVNWIFNVPNSKVDEPDLENPYILHHIIREMNHDNYDKYLEWMDKNNKSLPIKKVLTKEEWEFEYKLYKSLK
ncbi:MAG: hypothetical protein ACON4A_00100 [Flavobacteriaceae bacterium]